MTKFTTGSTLFALVSAGTISAFAMGAGAAERDANGDGLLTIEEVQAAYPEITIESFSVMDANADGALDAEEVAAAEQAGMIPASEG